MNKLIRKVKLISRNVLESVAYYSKFNPLYYPTKTSRDYIPQKNRTPSYRCPVKNLKFLFDKSIISIFFKFVKCNLYLFG